MTATQLKKIKQRLGLTNTALAALLGLTKYHVGEMVRGKRPVTNEIAAAARRLGDG